MIGNAAQKAMASLEARFGGLVDAVLAQKHLVVDEESRRQLLIQLALSMTELARRLKRAALGDYGSDVNEQRFPPWEEPKRSKVAPPAQTGNGSTLTALFEAWRKYLSPKTVDAYKSAITKLSQFLEHDDALQVSSDDIIRFKEHRLARGVSTKTVKDSDLAGLKAIFRWALDNRRLLENPAANVTIKVARRTELRTKDFADEEVKAILQAALRYQAKNSRELPETQAAKRWVPWLCAYTGVRVGEIAQLLNVESW